MGKNSPGYHKRYYQENREKLLDRSIARQTAHKEERRAYCKAYYQANKEKWAKPKKERDRMPIEERNKRATARARVHYHIKQGNIPPPSETCAICKKKIKTESHHHNGYEKEHQLDVIWVCQTCHGKLDVIGRH